jgi:hypothetical protein
MPTKLMSCGHRTELIRYEILGSGEQSKIVGLYHMMHIRFLGTDRAVALACTGHVGHDLEPDAPAVTAPYIDRSVCPYVPRLIALREFPLSTQTMRPESMISNGIFLWFDNLKE